MRDEFPNAEHGVREDFSVLYIDQGHTEAGMTSAPASLREPFETNGPMENKIFTVMPHKMV